MAKDQDYMEVTPEIAETLLRFSIRPDLKFEESDLMELIFSTFPAYQHTAFTLLVLILIKIRNSIHRIQVIQNC